MLHERSVVFEEFEQWLAIDKFNLDDAISTHAELLYRVTTALAYAANDRDSAKHDMEDCYARVSKQLREAASQCGSKTTEEQLKQNTIIHPSYTQAVKTYLDAKLVHDRLNALSDAFSSRGYMLREMANLWIANYFADTPVKADQQVIDTVRYQSARTAITNVRKRAPLKKSPTEP